MTPPHRSTLRMALAACSILVSASAGAAIDLPRGTRPGFRWEPAPGPLNGYTVYADCNDGADVRRQFTRTPEAVIDASFCDTLVVRVAAVRWGTDGGEGPLSEPSEELRFVGERVVGRPGADPPPVPGERARPLDFDGDGRGDALLGDVHSGELLVRTLGAGSEIDFGDLPPLDAGLSVVGNGDFDGNGHTDVLCFDPQSGQLEMWLVEGGNLAARESLGALAPGWQVAATGDHDGDGRADILLREPGTGAVELWSMDGTAVRAEAPLLRDRDASWQLAAAADFDGDGRDDLAWYQPEGARLEVWLLDAEAILSAALLRTGLGSGWAVAAAGDFDADGQADLLWRDPTSGFLGLWFLEAGTLAAQVRIQGQPRPGREVVGAADYDGDGHTDLLRRTPAGRLVIEFMSGAAMTGRQRFGTAEDPWSVMSIGQGGSDAR